MRFKKGKLYKIEFLDHCHGGTEALPFFITGRVVKLTRTTVVVAPWFYGTEQDFDESDPNVERFPIVRGAIQSYKEL